MRYFSGPVLSCVNREPIVSRTWQTKYGPRRVRRDEPTIAEAITAAQGLTSDLDEQAEIAAALMAVPVAEVRQEMVKLVQGRKPERQAPRSTPERPVRTVIVERKPSRRLGLGAAGLAARLR